MRYTIDRANGETTTATNFADGGYVPRRLRTWIYRCDSCDSTWTKDEREPLREQDGRDYGRDYVWGFMDASTPEAPKCGTCGGVGFRTFSDTNPVTCPTCHGTGEQPKGKAKH